MFAKYIYICIYIYYIHIHIVNNVDNSIAYNSKILNKNINIQQ